MKKTLFLAAALLMAPAMVRAEGDACGCNVTNIVTANWKYFAAGFALEIAKTVRPTDLTGSTLVVLDDNTAVNLGITQAVHTLVAGKKGIADLAGFVALNLGRVAGKVAAAQAAVLKPASN